MSLLPGGLEQAVTAIDGSDMGDPSTSFTAKPSAAHLTGLGSGGDIGHQLYKEFGAG
jgi:hypothetical protein